MLVFPPEFELHNWKVKMTQMPIKHEGSRQHLVALLEGELSAVTFVRDYVQLHFDGPTLDAFTLPTVIDGNSTIAEGDPGYRDALCARIRATVVAAYADPGKELRITFSDGSSLSISLRPEDRQTEEAAVYLDAQAKEWASW